MARMTMVHRGGEVKHREDSKCYSYSPIILSILNIGRVEEKSWKEEGVSEGKARYIIMIHLCIKILLYIILTALLFEDAKLPGVILSEPPRKVNITSRGKEANFLDEMGMSLSIPKNATTKDEQLDLATSFSGAYETPNDICPVSPAYGYEDSGFE